MTKLNGKTPPNPKLETLISEINFDYADTVRSTGLSKMSAAVERAMRTVPRELFVPKNERPYAYANHPLPIGDGQTISQPFIVALMTDLMQLDSNSKVLELGTGCGYQAAVLAEIAHQVYSIEIIAELGEKAFERLQDLGYDNIHYRTSDGSEGWPEAAPFDGIIATACGTTIPPAWIEQLTGPPLANSGRIVMPLERKSGSQELVVITKNADGTLDEQVVLAVRFVPITH